MKNLLNDIFRGIRERGMSREKDDGILQLSAKRVLLTLDDRK